MINSLSKTNDSLTRIPFRYLRRVLIQFLKGRYGQWPICIPPPICAQKFPRKELRLPQVPTKRTATKPKSAHEHSPRNLQPNVLTKRIATALKPDEKNCDYSEKRLRKEFLFCFHRRSASGNRKHTSETRQSNHKSEVEI